MSSNAATPWKVHGTKKGALPISLEKRPCGKKVTVISLVTNPHALIHELKGRLGTGGSVSANGDAEIQGDHLVNVTKFLLSREEHLIQVSGCGKNAKAREEKKRAEEEAAMRQVAVGQVAGAVARQDEEGKKARWSLAKKDAVARSNSRPDEPAGWSDDPRRCPFGWLYCSGICMGLTPAEFRATKQLVWAEESDFHGARDAGGTAKPLTNNSLAQDWGADLSPGMSLDAALRALCMLAMGVGEGAGWSREQEKKKKKTQAAVAPAKRAETSVGTFVPTKIEDAHEWERAHKLQAAADAFALAQIASKLQPLASSPASRGAKYPTAMRRGGGGGSGGGGTYPSSQGRPAAVGGHYKRGGKGGRGGGGGGGGGSRSGAGNAGPWRRAGGWGDGDEDGGASEEDYVSDDESAEHESHWLQAPSLPSHTLDIGRLMPPSHGARNGGGGSRRRQEEAAEEEAEEEAIMEAIARSLREEEDRDQRRGGPWRGGARCADYGEPEGEEGGRNLGEVAAMVESRGWVQRFGSTACEVLSSMVDFDWVAMVWGEDVGMSEEDAFLYALEISLDSVRKREASAGVAAAGARLGDSSAAAGGGGGGSGGRGRGLEHSGRAGASEGADEWEWQTVVPAARSRQEGPRFPLSHPHLGSGCKDTPGVHFEVDEYGRVRHFGAPVQAPAQGGSAKLEPRRVVQTSHDPLHGVAHRMYRKGDPEEEAEAELVLVSESDERERARKRAQDEQVVRDLNGGMSEEAALALILQASAASSAAAIGEGRWGQEGAGSASAPCAVDGRVGMELAGTAVPRRGRGGASGMGVRGRGRGGSVVETRGDSSGRGGAQIATDVGRRGRGAYGGGHPRNGAGWNAAAAEAEMSLSAAAKYCGAGIEEREQPPEDAGEDFWGPAAQGAGSPEAGAASGGGRGLPVRGRERGRGRGGRSERVGSGGNVDCGVGGAGSEGGGGRQSIERGDEERAWVVMALVQADDAIKQYVMDVARDAAIGSEAGLRQAVAPLLLSCSDEDEAEVYYVISQLWRLLRAPQECLDERGASAGRDARGQRMQETAAGGAKRNVDKNSIGRDRGEQGEGIDVNTLGDEHEDALGTLVGMGFTRGQARDALHKSALDLSAAIDMLLAAA